MNTTIFLILILFSLVLILSFQIGQRRNLRYLKSISQMLEEILKAEDKKYTLLGGVVGFNAEYRVKEFEKVIVSVTLLPRQSLLYLPIAWLRGGYDKIDILFYLHNPLNGESHIVKRLFPKFRMPTIYNREGLKRKIIKLDIGEYDLYYTEKGESINLLKEMIKDSKNIIHMAYTPEKKILYIRIRFKANEIRGIKIFLNRIIGKCKNIKP